MRALGVVELERACERAQHALRGAVHVAALEASVVRNADARQDSDLLTAQSGNPATAIADQPDLVWSDSRATGGEELADLLFRVHAPSVDRPGRAWETLPVPLPTGTLTSRDPVLSWM